MKQIRVGIIGFGLSGRYFFAPFIDNHPHFNLVAFVSSQTHTINLLYPDATVFSNAVKLIQSNMVDLLVISTPNITHFEYAAKALAAGKHVVVEKPFTVNTQQAHELISLAKKYNKLLIPFHNRRWDGDFLTLKTIIEEGDLGDVLEFESHFDRYNPLPERAGWKREKRIENSVLFDLGPHLIDQVLQLFGMPQAVYAQLETQRPKGSNIDYFDIHLYYQNKKAILKAGVFVHKNDLRFAVHGTKASYIKYGIDPQENNLRKQMPVNSELGADSPQNYGVLYQHTPNKVVSLKVPTIDGNYMAFFDGVYNALTKNNNPPVTAQQAAELMFIIEKSIESNQKKQAVFLNRMTDLKSIQ
jgi:scyllo-inositol 2-dehydrogenase (NADP+)